MKPLFEEPDFLEIIKKEEKTIDLMKMEREKSLMELVEESQALDLY